MSIYDLPQDLGSLASLNQGTSRLQWNEVPATRNVTNESFSQGPIDYRFEMSGNRWWIPSKTYMRIRCSYKKNNGDNLLKRDDIAPNMGLASNLFSSCQFTINNKVVSRVGEYMPQIDALMNRTSKSDSWLDVAGEELNLWDSDHGSRANVVCEDGETYDKLTGYDPTTLARITDNGLGYTGAVTVAYTAATRQITLAGGNSGILDLRTFAPLGSSFAFTNFPDVDGNRDPRNNVFIPVIGHVNATTIVLGASTILTADVPADNGLTWEIRRAFAGLSGPDKAKKVNKFEMIWQPPLSIFHSVHHAMPCGKYQLTLQPHAKSVLDKTVVESLLSNKFNVTDFKIEGIFMYVCEVEGPRVTDSTYYLDLTQYRCQSHDVQNASYTQHTFNVSPSTQALCVSFQDARVQSDTRCSASKFKAYSRTGLVDDRSPEVARTDTQLRRLFLTYAGQQFPQPDASPEFDQATDYTTQRWYESQLNTGAHHDTGAPESQYEWLARGPYYYWMVPRSGEDRSTSLTVHHQFAEGTNVDSTRLLVFDVAKQIARVRIQDSMVVDIQLEDS